MSTLEYRLKDPTYKNWVKSGLCLALVKEGLEEYADIKSKEFHAAVLASVAKLKTLQTSVCDKDRISFNYNKIAFACKHTFCQGFLDAIDDIGIDPNQKFTIRKANTDNCDVKLWHTDHWELAKLFMNPGQKPNQKMPSQTDLSGIINFLDHNDIARKGIHNVQHIDEVRKARNSVMHTSDMKVSPNDFKTFTKSMVDLLSDSKLLAQLPSAQKGVSEIQRVHQSDFHIMLEDEIGIIKNLISALRKATDDTKTETKELKMEFLSMQHVSKEEKKHFQSRMQQMEEDAKEVACSLTTLKKLVPDDKTLEERIGQEIKNLHDSLEQADADLRSAHNDVKRRLAELEEKHVELELKTSAIMEDVSAHSDRLTQLESTKMPDFGDKDCRKLRMDLVEEYSHIYEEVSLSPFGDGLNDEALRVPIDKIYSDLKIDIVKIKGNKQSERKDREKAYSCRLKSYSEMFSDKEIKNIVIKGEGGTGKSTWCKRLLHAWCQVQRQALGMKGARSGDEANTEMEESLKRFDYLFHVTLAHVKRQSSLKDTIFSACFERLSMQRNVGELILENFSENVLILLDGFDEYPFTLDCQGLGQSTIVMTTRPWKYDVLCSHDNTFKVDAVSEIHGLTKQGVEELSKKVISSYNKQYSDMGSDSSNEEQTSKFLRDTRSAELSNSIRIPLILIITALAWMENKSLSKSLTYNILVLLEVLFRRGENKLWSTDKAVLKRLELEKRGASVFHKSLTERYTFMRDNQVLLQHLGRLAYKGLTDQKKGISLVLREDKLHEFLDPDELKICYKLGLLTGSTVTTSLLKIPQVSISFYQKLIQELFAAISIISDSDILSEFTQILASLTAVLEMENVILFIIGLNPSIGSDLSKHFVGLVDTDDSICRYRRDAVIDGKFGNYSTLLFKCMLEWDIVHERKEQKRLCLTDLIIDSDFDNKLRLCTYHNREHLKSLTVRVDSSESVNIIPILSQLTTLTSAATTLQSLDINVKEVNCEGINTIDTTNFDLTSNEHLENVSIQGIRLSNGQHFLSVTFGKTVQLRTVKIENAVIKPLYLQNNTELELKDVKISEIRLPPTLEQLKYVRLESVTMSGPSWSSFFTSLQSPSLTWLILKNLNIDDITIILENSSRLEWLVLEDVKVSEIRLPTRLKYVRLESVTMPGPSWNIFTSLVQLTLKNLNIDDITIILENSSGLDRLELEDVKVSGIRLPTRLEQLKEVRLQSVTMPGPSWNSFFQSLQSPSLTKLTFMNLNIDDITIILENSSGLTWIELEDVKVSGIRLPTRLEQLKEVRLQSVTMPGPSWNSFFQSLQSPSLTKLTLMNLNIDDITIILENSSGLTWIELEDVKVSKFRLPTRLEQLKEVRLQSVTMPGPSWNSFFQSLQSASLSKLILKNPNIDDITIILENSSGLTRLELEDVKVSEIRLPTRLDQLWHVTLQSVTMPGSSWNSVFQSLQSASLSKLILKNLNIDDRAIILENSSGLEWLVLEDVKVSEIRLPTRLEQLKEVRLESVTMPGPSWNSVFTSLQSPYLSKLILKNLNIDDRTIILENSSRLEWLVLEDVKVSEIRLPTRQEQLEYVRLQSVTMPGSSWNSFFQSLQLASLASLTLKNLTLDDIFIRRAETD